MCKPISKKQWAFQKMKLCASVHWHLLGPSAAAAQSGTQTRTAGRTRILQVPRQHLTSFEVTLQRRNSRVVFWMCLCFECVFEVNRVWCFWDGCEAVLGRGSWFLPHLAKEGYHRYIHKANSVIFSLCGAYVWLPVRDDVLLVHLELAQWMRKQPTMRIVIAVFRGPFVMRCV